MNKLIKNKPFHLEEGTIKRDIFTVSLNKKEREELNKSKIILEQTKDSTALKQLAWIGAKVIHEEKVSYILASIFKNKRNNERLGIVDFE
jgi:hypothetical protein